MDDTPPTPNAARAAADKLADEHLKSTSGCLAALAETALLVVAQSFVRLLPIYYGWRWFAAPLSPSLTISAGRIYGLSILISALTAGIATSRDVEAMEKSIAKDVADKKSPTREMIENRKKFAKGALVALLSLLTMYVVHRLCGAP